jgi:two-component system NarL family sensor kinase
MRARREHSRTDSPGRRPSRPAVRRGGRQRELAILNAVAEAWNSASDVHEALERTLALVTKLLGMRTGWVWLVDAETGQFYSAAAQNLPPYLQAPIRMTGTRCWCISAFDDGSLRPRNIDVMECSRLWPAVKAQATDVTRGLRFHASVPLSFQGRLLGILNVTGPSWRKLTASELRLLSTIAAQVGVGIDRARLAEQSTRLARTEERTRLAREIHDTLAQDLTGITLHLESALRHLDADASRTRERLTRALALSRASLEEARRSVLNLRAAPLAGKSLAEALAALGRRFASETGVRVYVSAENAGEIPQAVESELYRIAQEALTNVRKHAAATEVRIDLMRRGGALRLRVRDDGRGVDARARTAPRVRAQDARGDDAPRIQSHTAGGTQSGGHGILGIRERAQLLGGTLRIESAPRAGTTLIVRVPLTAPHARDATRESPSDPHATIYGTDEKTASDRSREGV